MTGPKLNEGALLIAEGQPTIKATAKYLRGSASKAREVLDLIRGLDVRRADEVLQFTTRDVAQDVRKVLASAVANAVHNDAQDAEELYVLAAFADEGPTLRRFRPRARGRATRIRKRTSHITVVVARLSDERLEVLQSRQQAASPTARRAGTTAQSRRDRVERSRTRAQGLKGDTESTETEATDTDDTDTTEIQGFADVGEAGDATETAAELPTGAVEAPEDGSTPPGHEIKGNASSMKYHVPGGRYYDATIAEVFFDTTEHAEAAGYEAPAADEAAVEALHDDEAATAAETTEADVQGFADVDTVEHGEAGSEGAEPSSEGEAAGLAGGTSAENEVELPAGAVVAPEDGSTPPGYEIKGNASSKKFHVPGGRYYDITIAEVFFDTVASAEAAGYEAPAADADLVDGEDA